MEKKDRETNRLPASFSLGAISLAFLIIGYEASLFIHRASALALAERQDKPDTVYVFTERIIAQEAGVPAAVETVRRMQRRNAIHPETVERIRSSRRRYECFRFNPNTVSVEELQRLGFSEKQAAAIYNYRSKGGRFRRKSDFGRSYVVADSVFKRLEPYIDIPKTDINKADSAAFDDLPGIGGYFARRLIEYRERLGGFSYPGQMMEIRNFDSLKFAGLQDLVTCSRPAPYRLWSLPAEELRKHPYIGTWQTARSVVFFREHNDVSRWSVEALAEAGVLSREAADRLGKCLLEEPPSASGVVDEN